MLVFGWVITLPRLPATFAKEDVVRVIVITTYSVMRYDKRQGGVINITLIV